MMPLGAPGISKYGSLVRSDAQIVALRAHCAKCAPLCKVRLRCCKGVVANVWCTSTINAMHLCEMATHTAHDCIQF